MELKRKHTERFEPVYVREEIIEINEETIVPDGHSDLMRIAAASVSIVVKDKRVVSGRIELEGSCNVNVLAITEGCSTGEIINVVLPMSHIISDVGAKENDVITCNAVVLEPDVNLINSRKISVKPKIQIEVKVYRCNDLWLTTGVPQDDNTYCLKKEFCDEYISCVCEKKIRLVENILLENENLIPFGWSVEFDSEDIKAVKDKVMVRGVCRIRVLFIDSVSGTPVREKYHLPFSVVVENERFENADKIDIKYNCPFAVVSASKTVEGYKLSCDVMADVKVIAYRSNNEQIVADIFNSKFELDTKWEQISCLVKINTEKIKKDISFSFGNVDNADVIHDFTYNVTKRVSGKKIYVSIIVYVIYKDELGEICGTVCRYNSEHEMPNSFYDIDIKLNNISLQCGENGNFLMNGEMLFEVNFGGIIEMNQLSGCNILEDSCKTKKSDAALVLRKMAADETIWDIAKRYNTSPGAIRQANNIEETENMYGRLIMIPIVK